MYTHICISSNNLEQSSGFYNAALEPLGVQNIGKFNDRSVGYSDGKGNMMLLMTPFDGGEASPANGVLWVSALKMPNKLMLFTPPVLPMAALVLVNLASALMRPAMPMVHICAIPWAIKCVHFANYPKAHNYYFQTNGLCLIMSGKAKL